MNKIVQEHYPVEKLPEDLRRRLPAKGLVRVEMEMEAPARETYPGFAALELPPSRPMSLAETVARMTQSGKRREKPVSMEEAVARVRELRDEWDD